MTHSFIKRHLSAETTNSNINACCFHPRLKQINKGKLQYLKQDKLANINIIINKLTTTIRYNSNDASPREKASPLIRRC